jgi:ATP-dependent RNA helicase SUPV3L1/SUV3
MWWPGSPAPQPAGAFEGIGFTITQAMTSLTGSSGEDFASVLRALGYRMEKRPKPALREPVKPADVETLPVVEEAASAAARVSTGSDPAQEVVPDSTAQIDGEPPAGGEPCEARQPVQDSSSPETASQTSADPSAAGGVSEIDGAADLAAPGASAPDTAEAADATAIGFPAAATAESAGELQALAATAEPEVVEVWRPGGRSEDRRGQRRPPQWQRAHQSQGETATKATGATTDGAGVEDSGKSVAEAAAPAEKKGAQHRRPRGPQGEFRRDREEGGQRPREYRSERQGDRAERGRGERPNLGKGRGDYKDRRDFTPHREREKQADPNSPFAKLAALKAQLEAAAKEGR